MTRILFCAGALALTLLIGCRGMEKTAPPPVVSYTPLSVGALEPTGYPSPGRGTIQGDFHWACAAPALADAEQRWNEYLQRHGPYEGNTFEDAPHLNYYILARHELMRVYYLEGKVEEADAILDTFNPVTGSGGAP